MSEEFLNGKSLLLRAVCSLLQGDVGRVQDAAGLFGAKEMVSVFNFVKDQCK